MAYDTSRFSDDQRLIKENILQLLADVLPEQKIAELDASYAYPHQVHRAMADAGWLGLGIDEEWGGQPASHKDMVTLVEACSYHHCSATSVYMTNVVYGGMYVQAIGSQEQKQRLLPGIVEGRIKTAVAYSEPQGGSDLAGVRTTAVREGDEFVLNGQKVFITNAHVADYIIVIARTGATPGHRGLSLFVVDTSLEGIDIRPMYPMGRRTTIPNEVFFQDVRVPEDCLLGAQDAGWRHLMRGLNLERVLISAFSAGQCLKAIDLARDWVKDRVAFGKRLAEFQAVSHKLADMQMLAETARLHAFSAAERLDAGEDAVLQASIAKVVASENGVKCMDLGMQVMGGAGYMEGPMSRLYRDVKIGTIGGGSSEVMRNSIAKMMGL